MTRKATRSGDLSLRHVSRGLVEQGFAASRSRTVYPHAVFAIPISLHTRPVGCVQQQHLGC